jgi:peptidoglycan/xylan/chitin deacetylase (PgdA/CDA1 family)
MTPHNNIPFFSRFHFPFLLLSPYFLLLLSCLSRSSSTENNSASLPREDKEVVCFIYHRFGDRRYPTTNTPVTDFEAHLAYLKKNNFRMLTFSEAINYIQSDEPARKTAVLTIDDGYKSFYENGLPLLKKYNVPATLFINTKTVGGSDFMDWPAIADAMKNNIEIGNHTHSHDFFLNKNEASRYDAFEEEIELSQSIIFENLHTTPVVFSYPYGEFDNKMKKIVKEAGFKAAAAQNSGVLYTSADLFQCPRFPMSESYSAKEKFAEKAAMKPLKILSRSPDHFTLPPDKKPLLTLTFDGTDLRLDQLQCFVQGGECALKIIDKQKVTITVQATQPITKRRRTLYTVTVPDKEGVWHWYSHLWINEKVK